jgi:hypothetical protein
MTEKNACPTCRRPNWLPGVCVICWRPVISEAMPTCSNRCTLRLLDAIDLDAIDPGSSVTMVLGAWQDWREATATLTHEEGDPQ